MIIYSKLDAAKISTEKSAMLPRLDRHEYLLLFLAIGIHIRLIIFSRHLTTTIEFFIIHVVVFHLYHEVGAALGARATWRSPFSWIYYLLLVLTNRWPSAFAAVARCRSLLWHCWHWRACLNCRRALRRILFYLIWLLKDRLWCFFFSRSSLSSRLLYIVDYSTLSLCFSLMFFTDFPLLASEWLIILLVLFRCARCCCSAAST